VAPREAVIEGRPFFAAGYPISATLLWGVARGPMAGFASGTALSLALIASRPVNGVALTSLDTQGLQNLAGGVVNYLVAGTAVGLVSEVLERSAAAVHRTNQELLKEREQTARLQERARLARQIHDSVLQTLAMVHKRGRELARAGHDVASEEVALLAETAGRQESELRSLILRAPEDSPSGRSSLRASLERVAQGIDGVPVEVSTVGSIWMEQELVSELTAAVRQALENVVEHAHASRVSLFAEEVDSWVSVSVRDDGVGFVYDESALQAKKKAGMLRSMKGRVEDLGGTMAVETGPGRGTEIELRVPCSKGVEP
jgi:signal transduction histidine kinase